MEGDDKTKVVHRNLLLPLLSDPSHPTNELDNKSMVDQTESTQAVIAAGTITGHVHNLSTYGRVQVIDIFQKDWGLLQLCLHNRNTVIYWV